MTILLDRPLTDRFSRDLKEWHKCSLILPRRTSDGSWARRVWRRLTPSGAWEYVARRKIQFDSLD